MIRWAAAPSDAYLLSVPSFYDGGAAAGEDVLSWHRAPPEGGLYK
jgi:hypothetical protein